MLKYLGPVEAPPSEDRTAPVVRAPRPARAVTVYCDPGAVLADPRLSPGEQRRVLDDWAQDLADRDIAVSEGLAEPLPESDTKTLREVRDAIACVEAMAPPPLLVRLLRLLGSD